MTPPLCSACGCPLTPSPSGGYCPRCAGRWLLSRTPPNQPAEADADSDDDATTGARASSGSFGEYELGPELGRGAMGVVYRARQPRLKREVAVKMILAHRFAGETARKRFLSEAELAAQLDHPNIVPIYEVGETTDGPFYIMKLVEGGTLADRFAAEFGAGRTATANEAGSGEGRARKDTLRFTAAAECLAKIARAVHHAHQRGILHRDLKPGNILLDAQNEPHVTDFGLARQIGADTSLTHSGSALGTPAYMSPEQATEARGVTTAADVWSLGAILFHLLAGRPPFVGESVADILLQARTREAPALRALDPSVPRDLETICGKCLEKEPSRRYDSALRLAEDLERWLNAEPIRARPVGAAERLRLWCRRHPAVAALSAAVLLLLVILAVGSPIAALRIAHGRNAAQEATRKAEAELRNSLEAQARSGRLSRERGFRQKGLQAIVAAARIRPSLELRNEAIAHLISLDLEDAGDTGSVEDEVTLQLVPDQARYVAYPGGTNKYVTVRHWPDRAQVSRWVPTPSEGPTFRLLPNPRFILTHTDGYYEIVEAEQRRVIYRHPSRMVVAFDQFGCYDFSLDGRYAAWLLRDPAGLRRHVGVVLLQLEPFREVARWRIDSPAPPAALQLLTGQRIKINPAEKAIACINGSVVEIRSWETGQIRDRFEHDMRWSELVWERDLLAARDHRGALRVWDMKTRRPVSIQTRNHGPLLLSPQADLLISHDEFTWETSVFNPRSGRLLLTASEKFSTFSADQSRLSYLRDPVAGLWRVTNSRGYRTLPIDMRTTRLEFSAGGEWLLTTGSKSAELFDVRSGEPLKLALENPSSAQGFRFMPDGNTVLAGGSRTNTLPLWSFEVTAEATGRELRFRPSRVINVPGDEPVSFAALSPDRRWLAASWENKNRRGVLVLDLEHPDRTPANCRIGSSLLALRTEGSALVTAHRIIETATSKTLHEFKPEHLPGWAGFSADGRWLATTTPQELRIFDCATWKVVSRIPRRDTSYLMGQEPFRGVFSTDSRLLAIPNNDRTRVELFETTNWRPVATLTPPEPSVITGLAFSSRGILAVTTQRGYVFHQELSDPNERRKESIIAPERISVQLWDLPELRRELGGLGLDWDGELAATGKSSIAR